MATIKSYTDLSQSKKLAEILPLESADMYYQYVLPKSGKIKHNPEIGNPINALEWYNKGYTTSGKEPITLDEYCVPCWSLAALLDALSTLDNKYTVFGTSIKESKWNVIYRNIDTLFMVDSGLYSNLVDACVCVIEKLNELKMF